MKYSLISYFRKLTRLFKSSSKIVSVAVCFILSLLALGTYAHSLVKVNFIVSISSSTMNSNSSRVPPLFLQVTQSEVKRSTHPTITRLRYDQVNSEVFKPQTTGVTIEVSERIVLNLFSDASYTAVQRAVKIKSLHQLIWMGTLEGWPLSEVTLVVNDHEITGNINVAGTVYWIRPWQNQLHIIQQVNSAAFPLGAYYVQKVTSSNALSSSPIQLPPRAIKVNPQIVNPPPKIEVTIDIMVVYTPAVARASQDIEGEILLAMEETNLAYVNSGIYQQLQLVYTGPVDYQESGSHLTDLKQLTYHHGQSEDMAGVIDEVLVLREIYHADLVSLWVEQGNKYTCGMGWVLSPVSTMPSDYGFSVVERYCASAPAYSLAHELGHNMGATHDKYATVLGLGGGINGAYEYSHGYVYAGGDSAHSWRTILASDKECRDKGYECPRLPYFSNPNIFYGKVPMGNDGADNSLTLNNTATTVATFRN